MRGDYTIRWVMAVVLLATSQLVIGKPIGLVTILQGKATVTHALSRFDTVEGVRLAPDDLVETEKDSLVRVEYEDGTWLELGPETALQVSHPADRRAKRPALYLLTGWLKLGCAKGGAGPSAALASGGMDLVDLSGVIVIRATDDSRSIFAEQGSARWIDRASKGMAPVTLNGNFLVAAHGRAPNLQGRPTANFLDEMPRAYRDTLPVRYGLFVDKPVIVKGERSFSYADVEPWINAEPSVRRQFVVSWRRKTNDSAFRNSLDRDLARHPEWDRVLHPEKYELSEPPYARSDVPKPHAPATTKDNDNPARGAN